jgi:hypothetical protein
MSSQHVPIAVDRRVPYRLIMPVIAERRSGNERFKFLIVGHPHGSVTSSVASTRTPSATRIGHCMGGESCPKQVLYDTFSAAKAGPGAAEAIFWDVLSWQCPGRRNYNDALCRLLCGIVANKTLKYVLVSKRLSFNFPVTKISKSIIMSSLIIVSKPLCNAHFLILVDKGSRCRALLSGWVREAILA